MRDAADQSVGAALQVSAQLGRVGAPLADAARESFVYAMSRASLVTAAVALVGALLAWRFLPARAAEAHAPAAHEPVERWSRRSRTQSWRRRADSGTSGRFRSAVPPSGHGSALLQPASATPTGQLNPVPPRPQ